jgi:uncharacterized membrane protein
MTKSWHLWAIGYDDMSRADQVRSEVTHLGWENHYLVLGDVAVLVRHPDGSFTFNKERIHTGVNVAAGSVLGFLVGLLVAAPISGATVGGILAGTASAVSATVGLDENFVREAKELMKPGTSALLVLDDAGDMEVILHRIRGMGGTVLKTNVDVERAKLIQSTLAAAPATPAQPPG